MDSSMSDLDFGIDVKHTIKSIYGRIFDRKYNVYYDDISITNSKQFVIDTVAYIKSDNIYITKTKQSVEFIFVTPNEIHPLVIEFKDDITYDKLVYEPNKDHIDNTFNLFCGLEVWNLSESTYEPKTENIIKYIKSVFCRDNESTYKYLINWLADIVKNKQMSNDIFINIKSKYCDIFWDWFCVKILGQHNCNQNSINCKNPYKLLHITKCNYDEVKSLAIDYPNNSKCRFILHSNYTYGPTSNMFQIAPLISSNNSDDIKFIIESFDDDTAIDFYNYLVNQDLEHWNPKDIPYMQEEKTVVQLFVDDINNKKHLIKINKLLISEAYSEFIKWCNDKGYINKLTKTEFKYEIGVYTCQKINKTINFNIKETIIDKQISKPIIERESVIHKEAKYKLKKWLDDGLSDYTIDETVVEYPIIETNNWNSLEINQWPLSGPPSYETCKHLNKIPIAIVDIMSFKDSIPLYAFEICHTNPVSDIKIEKLNKIIEKTGSKLKMIEIDASWINNQIDKPDKLVIKRVII